jgi:4-hydroxy-tetrahydrodipicolinate synthase
MFDDKQRPNVICPMVTPFDRNGEINLSKVSQLVNHLYSGGIRYLLVAGTTGEGMLLSVNERKQLTEEVVKSAQGKCKVIIHTGCISTKETIQLTQHAKNAGVDAASIITPFFFPYSQDELFDHYSKIAVKIDEFPILLYSYPDNSNNYLSTSVVKKLMNQFPNYIGIKLSDINLIQFQEYLVAARNKKFSVLCGVDALMLPALSVGSNGQVSGNSNVFPEIFCDLISKFHEGKLDNAQNLQRKINKIRKVLRDNVSYFKAALRIRGLDVGPTRSPLHWFNDDEFKKIEIEMRNLLGSISGDGK